jgi:subtilisin family serine protease/WD40 repeat protein
MKPISHRFRKISHLPRGVPRRPLVESLENRLHLAAQLMPVVPFAPGELLVGLEGELAAQFRMDGPGKAIQSAADHFADWGLGQGEVLAHRSSRPLHQDRLITRWKLDPGKDVMEVAAELAQLPGVAYAEPNYLVSTAATQRIPNDTKFTSLWGMHNTGQSGGTADADVDAPEAWGRHTGTGNVVVAVIDTGVNHSHTDLRNNIWTNDSECPDGYGSCVANNVDEDNNGYFDDFYGYDFVNNDSDPKDDNGHGTHVSGTIGATGNNGTGVVGVDWDVQIMGLKFLGSNGGGTTADAIEAVQYATDMRARGVNVVLTSNSWGGGAFSQALYDAIAESGDAGMLFVAAAGNNGGSSAIYPALYDLDNIVSVTATDRHDQLASFSNRGTGVDIGAPGVDVYSTYRNNYSTLSGTSMATPHVSGTAALLADYLITQSVTPTYANLRDCLYGAVDRIAATLNTVSTGGRLNAHNSLLCGAAIAGEVTGISIDDVSVLEGDSGTFDVELTVTRFGRLDTTTELDWTTADHSASADGDYHSASGHLVFPQGETTQRFVVTIQGDTAMEPDESFQVLLSNVMNTTNTIEVFLNGGRATVAIVNDDIGMVSRWSADGTAADAVGGNHGTLVSGAAYAAGQIGQAFSFDGVDDRVLVADSESLKLTRSLTIEAWVRVDSFPASNHGEIFFRGDDRGGLDPYSIAVEPSGRFSFLISGESGGLQIETPVPTGQFIHVAATLDDTTGNMRIYVNGALGAEQLTTRRPFRDLNPASNPGIGIGNHGGYPNTPHNFPFHGLIDELKVYNYALSAEQVLENFNAGKGTLQPSISISDATAIEGDDTAHFRGTFIPGNFNTLTFGPDGDLYAVGGAGNTSNSVRRYNGATGQFVNLFATAPTTGALRDLIFHTDGDLYVASIDTHEVLRFNGTTGEFVDVFVSAGNGGISNPDGLAFGPDGNLYVTGWTSHNVVKYDGQTGLPIGTYISAGSGGLSFPFDIEFGPGGAYVTSAGTSQILKYDVVTGAFLGVAASTGLDYPRDVAFGPDGLMYVASGNNDRILRFTPSGSYVNDYVPAAAGGMDNPRSLAFSPDGDMYVAAHGNNRNIFRYGNESELVFVVSLDAPSPTPVSVDFVTSNGSAVDSSDFAATSGTLVFAPGEMRKSIFVPTIDDDFSETTETMFVNLANASDALIADSQAMGTIIDNDQSAESSVAASETHTFGIVTGTYFATHSADGQVQTLTEEKYSGNKRSRLEHSWRFDDVTAGSELVVIATHLNNTGVETFAFAYSSDNLNWTTLGNLGPASFALPGNVSGTVYIRVTDTDRSLNEATQDVLAVDQLLIRATPASAGGNFQLAAALHVDTNPSSEPRSFSSPSPGAESPLERTSADPPALDIVLADPDVLDSLFDAASDDEQDDATPDGVTTEDLLMFDPPH